MSDTTTTEQTKSPQHAAVIERLGLLEQSLLAKDPMMPVHLKEIHTHLIQYEELVHLLKDEEIGVLMAAQQVQTNTTLTSSTSTKSGKAKAVAASAKLGIADL